MDTQDLFLEIGREFHLTYDQVSEICNRLTGRFLEITSSTREQIEREILGLFEYTETEAYQRAGFYYDRDDVMTAIASG